VGGSGSNSSEVNRSASSNRSKNALGNYFFFFLMRVDSYESTSRVYGAPTSLRRLASLTTLGISM